MLQQRQPHPVDVYVGERIRDQRLHLGLTHIDLAAQTGVTFQQIQKYEKGINRVSASRLWMIAKVLDVPIGYFFADIEDGPKADSVDEVMKYPETKLLVRLYYRLQPRLRRSVLDLLSVMVR